MDSGIEFVIVRHGETVGNIKGLLQGQTDGELNDLGVRQAAAAAEYLHDVHFNAAYSSDLKRAMDTAQIIVAAGHPGLQVVPTPGLREWHLGRLESRLQKELIVEYPEIMDAFRFEKGEVVVAGGENKSVFYARVEACLRKLAGAHLSGERVLLVTHGGTMQMILRVVTGDLRRGNLVPLTTNASISTIRYYPSCEGWQLVSWNRTEHLKNLEIHPTLVY